MFEYNNLSPLEFEYVCQDVMQATLGLSLRRFTPGRDGGIDLVDDLSTCNTVVQVKHYLKSPFSTLKQALKKELPKVQKLNPKHYFLCCGQVLSPAQVREIYGIFSAYMTSEKNIVTLLEIDAFLCAPENIEILRKHFKLWLSATNILSELYNQNIFVDSEALFYDIHNELPYYVQTESYLKSRSILESDRLLMILGNPGIGKTTISKMLILYFASVGYRVRYTTNGELSDIKKAISADKQQKEIILLDDCLGQCYFRMKDTQENELSALIKYVTYHPSKILLLNSRITIFNAAKEQSPEFSQLFDRNAIRIKTINAEDIHVNEKALILYALLRKFKVPNAYYQSVRNHKNYRKIVQHQNYNPRIIEYVSWRHQDAENPDGFFDFLMDKIQYPKNVWKDEFERRLDRVDRYFMYTLYSLTNSRVYADIDVLRRAYQNVLPAIQADISINHFENVLLRLSKSLVRIISREQKIVHTREPFYNLYVPGNSREISVLNPSINDYLEDVFHDPLLRRFFKEHAYYIEQVVHMCDTEEELRGEIEKLAETGCLEHIKSIHSDFTQSIILFFVVGLNLKDSRYEPCILPGLANFPTHYYVSSILQISRRKPDVILSLLEEPLFSFYHMACQINSPEGAEAVLRDLDIKNLIIIANRLNGILSFDDAWKRDDFVRILRNELQEAGQYYLDGNTSSYNAEEYSGNFDSYRMYLEDDLYEYFQALEVDEIAYEDFSWDLGEWFPEHGGDPFSEAHDTDRYEENEIDLILDRDLE